VVITWDVWCRVGCAEQVGCGDNVGCPVSCVEHVGCGDHVGWLVSCGLCGTGRVWRSRDYVL
jgi:hypothetical protein